MPRREARALGWAPSLIATNLSLVLYARSERPWGCRGSRARPWAVSHPFQRCTIHGAPLGSEGQCRPKSIAPGPTREATPPWRHRPGRPKELCGTRPPDWVRRYLISTAVVLGLSRLLPRLDCHEFGYTPGPVLSTIARGLRHVRPLVLRRAHLHVPEPFLLPRGDFIVTEEYRATSLLATMRERWNLGAPFTAREESARSFQGSRLSTAPASRGTGPKSLHDRFRSCPTPSSRSMRSWASWARRFLGLGGALGTKDAGAETRRGNRRRSGPRHRPVIPGELFPAMRAWTF
jgi:hypothetical protein